MGNYTELNQIELLANYPIALLFVALVVLGAMLKKSELTNRWIPLWIGVVGTAGGGVLMHDQYGWMVGLLIGFICAGLSVGVYSGVKNTLQK